MAITIVRGGSVATTKTPAASRIVSTAATEKSGQYLCRSDQVIIWRAPPPSESRQVGLYPSRFRNAQEHLIICTPDAQKSARRILRCRREDIPTKQSWCETAAKG